MKTLLGGSLLYENDIKINSLSSKEWVNQIVNNLYDTDNVTVLTRGTVFGYHDHNYITIAEKCLIKGK